MTMDCNITATLLEIVTISAGSLLLLSTDKINQNLMHAALTHKKTTIFQKPAPQLFFVILEFKPRTNLLTDNGK
jgi:hypothetical protein